MYRYDMHSRYIVITFTLKIKCKEVPEKSGLEIIHK